MDDIAKEDALDRAKKVLKDSTEDEKKVVYFIFPELKESEDEQPRKWILEYLHDGLRKSDEQFKDQFKCAIAWFEKQGEQKEQREHVWTLQDAAPGDILNSTRVQATIIFKGFNPDGKHIDAYCALQKGIFIHQELPWDMDFEPAPIFWIVELFRRMNESGYMWNPEKEELVNIKQRSAEWSQEDEGIASQIITDLNDCESEWGLDRREEKTWLESIKSRVQPQWKPSDEQMDALKGVAFYNNSESLKSLYKELKKLKG